MRYQHSFLRRQTMLAWRTRQLWCLELIPAELGTVTETVYDVKADSTWVFFKESIVAWRTENVWCVELIPAELEASAETVYDLKADSTWVFFKESIVAWRTENVRCVELIPADLKLPRKLRELLSLFLEIYVKCSLDWKDSGWLAVAVRVCEVLQK